MTAIDHKNIIEKVFDNHIKDHDIQPEMNAEEFAIENGFTDDESLKIAQGLFDAIADDYVNDTDRAKLKDMGLDMQVFDAKDWQFSWARKYALSDNAFRLESPDDYESTAKVLASLQQTDVKNLGELERTILGLHLKSKVYPLFKDFIPTDYSSDNKGLAEYFISGAYKKILIPVVQSSLDEKARHLALLLLSQEGDANTVKTLINLKDSFVIETADLAHELTTELITNNLAIAKDLLTSPDTDRTLAINLYLLLAEIDSPEAIHIVIKTAPRYGDQEVIAAANAALIAKGVVPFPKIRFVLQNETDFVFTDYLLSQADSLKDEIAAATSADLKFGSSTQATPLHMAYLKTHIDDLAAEPDPAPTSVHEQIDGYLNTPYKDFALALRAYATEQGLFATEIDAPVSLTTNREFREHRAKPLYEMALKSNPHQIFANNALFRIQNNNGEEISAPKNDSEQQNKPETTVPTRVSPIETEKVKEEPKTRPGYDPLELIEGWSITKEHLESISTTRLKEIIEWRQSGTYYAIKLIVDRTHSLEGLDLSGLNLGKVANDFENVRFKDCNLKNADLSGLNLFGANFSGADLEGAVLVEAQLRQANLEKANLTNANLYKANFMHARLNHANLTQANLTHTVLGFAELDGVTFDEAQLNDFTLAGANLTRYYLNR